MTGQGATGGLNLTGGQTLGFQSLQTEGPEIQFETTLGEAVDAALMRLAVFRTFWTKHFRIPSKG